MLTLSLIKYLEIIINETEYTIILFNPLKYKDLRIFFKS